MKFELDNKQTNDIRNMLKDIYNAHGMIKGFKEMGQSMIQIEYLLEAYYSYIKFVELVLNEPHKDFHKENRYSSVDKDKLKDLLNKSSLQ